MTVDELLDQIDDMIDKAWSMPLTGGKCLIEADHLRDIVDDIRGNMPSEIRQAKAIVADRTDIVTTAKREAEGIIRTAEERARGMVAREEVGAPARPRPRRFLDRPSRNPARCARGRRSSRRRSSARPKKPSAGICRRCGRRGRCCAIPPPVPPPKRKANKPWSGQKTGAVIRRRRFFAVCPACLWKVFSPPVPRGIWWKNGIFYCIETIYPQTGKYFRNIDTICPLKKGSRPCNFEKTRYNGT